jgi:hypothetical protein
MVVVLGLFFDVFDSFHLWISLLIPNVGQYAHTGTWPVEAYDVEVTFRAVDASGNQIDNVGFEVDGSWNFYSGLSYWLPAGTHSVYAANPGGALNWIDQDGVGLNGCPVSVTISGDTTITAHYYHWSNIQVGCATTLSPLAWTASLGLSTASGYTLGDGNPPDDSIATVTLNQGSNSYVSDNDVFYGVASLKYDVGLVDRPPTTAEWAMMPILQLWAVGLDGVAIVVSPDMSWFPTNLNTLQVANLFAANPTTGSQYQTWGDFLEAYFGVSSYSQIPTSWNGVSIPAAVLSEPIQRAVTDPTSGTFDCFNNYFAVPNNFQFQQMTNGFISGTQNMAPYTYCQTDEDVYNAVSSGSLSSESDCIGFISLGTYLTCGQEQAIPLNIAFNMARNSLTKYTGTYDWGNYIAATKSNVLADCVYGPNSSSYPDEYITGPYPAWHWIWAVTQSTLAEEGRNLTAGLFISYMRAKGTTQNGASDFVNDLNYVQMNLGDYAGGHDINSDLSLHTPTDAQTQTIPNGQVGSVDFFYWVNAYIAYYTGNTYNPYADILANGHDNSADFFAFVNQYIAYYTNPLSTSSSSASLSTSSIIAASSSQASQSLTSSPIVSAVKSGTISRGCWSVNSSQVDQCVNVDIRVDNATPYGVWGWSTNVNWNPQVLKLVRVEQGNFLSASGDSTMFIGGSSALWNNAAGTINGGLACCDMSSQSPESPDSSGVLATLTFQVMGYGGSNITLSDATLMASSSDNVGTVVPSNNATFTAVPLPASGIVSAVQSGTTNISCVTVYPSNKTVAVDVRIDNASNVWGWKVGVNWNPQVLQLANVTEGNFLLDTDSTTFVGGNPALWNNVNGTIVGGLSDSFAYSNVETATDQSGSLATLTFNIVGTGTSVVTLSNATLFAYSTDNGTNVTANDAIVTVTPSYIFSDSFESGNLNKWLVYSYPAGQNVPTATTSKSHTGSYSCEFPFITSGSPGEDAGIYASFTPDSSVWGCMRVWVYFSSFPYYTQNQYLFYIADNQGNQISVFATLSGKLYIEIEDGDYGALYDSPQTSVQNLAGSWHCLEVDYYNNVATLYIDGVSTVSVSHTMDYQDNFNQCGFLIQEPPSSLNNVWLDDVAVSDGGYIGTNP